MRYLRNIALSKEKFFKLLPSKLQKNLTFQLGGKGFYIPDPKHKTSSGKKIAQVNAQVVVDDDQPQDHRQAAQQVLQWAEQIIDSKAYEVVVLDEVCNALKDQLISLNQVLSLIKKRGSIHMILTGRDCPPELVKVADMVTEMSKIKHPFDQGQNAVKGLDF